MEQISQAEQQAKLEYPPNKINMSQVISTPIHQPPTLNHTHHATCSAQRKPGGALPFSPHSTATHGSQEIRAPGSTAAQQQPKPY